MPNPGLLRDVIGNDHSGHLIGGSCLPEEQAAQEFAIPRYFPPGACDPIVQSEGPFPAAQGAGRGSDGGTFDPLGAVLAGPILHLMTGPLRDWLDDLPI